MNPMEFKGRIQDVLATCLLAILIGLEKSRCQVAVMAEMMWYPGVHHKDLVKLENQP